MVHPSAIELSVVVPMYNEAARIGDTVRDIAQSLRGRSFEILCVDDGSTDATPQVVEELGGHIPEARLLRYTPNRGKGYAVRRGVLAAAGTRVLFSDADGSTPITELARLAAELDRGADIAIGSRGLSESSLELRQPWYRELLGRTFNGAVRLIAVPGIRDTQCGFKLFTRAAARAVFEPLITERYAFDVEVLLRARRLGLRVTEVPVRWRHESHSRVALLRDGSRMVHDLLRIRWRLWREQRRAPGSQGRNT